MSDLIERAKAAQDAVLSSIGGTFGAQRQSASDARYALEDLARALIETTAERDALRAALEWAWSGDGLDECALLIQRTMNPFAAPQKPDHAVQVGLRIVIDTIRKRAALQEDTPMSDTTDKTLDALQERLKAHDSHPESASAQADAVIAALRAQLADAQAALDAAEIEHGITSNGNLWRFWSKKASDLAKGNTTLRAQLATARADAVRVKPLVWELHINDKFHVELAFTILGRYKVQRTTGLDYAILCDPSGKISRHKNIEAAKAAAQADYEARIVAALEPTPSAPSPEAVVRAALEWAANCIECGCRGGECANTRQSARKMTWQSW